MMSEIGNEAVDEAGSSAMVDGEEYYNAEGGEWPEKLDTGQLCRICANPNEYLIPIFEGEGLEHELASKIKKHLPIEVSETDTLPRQVCYQCASTLIAWHDLVICCVEANKKLQEFQAEKHQDEVPEVFEAESYDSDIRESAVENKEGISDVKEEIDKTTKVSTKRTAHLAKEKKSKQKTLIENSFQVKSVELAEAASQEAKASESAKPKESISQESSERCEDLGQSSVFVTEIFSMHEQVSTICLKDEEQSSLMPVSASYALKKKYKKENTRDKICSICGRKYLTKKSLREHTKKYFLETVNCNICDRTYKN